MAHIGEAAGDSFGIGKLRGDVKLDGSRKKPWMAVRSFRDANGRKNTNVEISFPLEGAEKNIE